jgi:hypothetical protein
MKKVILWLLIVFFGILILSSLIGGSYEGFEEGVQGGASASSNQGGPVSTGGTKPPATPNGATASNTQTGPSKT